MKNLSLKLNNDYKSFNKNFQFQFEGDLILISGVNGSGKSQLLEIIYGEEKEFLGREINSTITLDGIQIKTEEIEIRTYKHNIEIRRFEYSSSQRYLDSCSKAWEHYKKNLLDPDEFENRNYIGACKRAKDILLQSLSEKVFEQKKLGYNDFKEKLSNSDFIWREDDLFANYVSDIFFNHAVKVSEKMKEVGRDNFDSSSFDIAPWKKLNDLFKELNFEYRFKENYILEGVEINEQPNLFAIKKDGSIDEENIRELRDLSDGEKTVISLCFASLDERPMFSKKIILLDEIDAVLSPALIEKLFIVLKRYFLDKGLMVILATHSSATISLAPMETKYYEVFKKNLSETRILEVNRDEYSELQIVNSEFYNKIINQKSRIEYLEGKIESDEEILIITEGKTDWKYIVKALNFFHSKKEFLNIKESYFYKYGSSEDNQNSICGTNKINDLGFSKLKNYLNSLLISRNIDESQISKKRIGIFDSDINDGVINDKKNGVYSFKIEPDGISTEFLFNDNEIKTEISGRRLYIGDEFDKRSKKNILNPKLSVGGKSDNTNKAGKHVIIDTDIYNLDNENVALTKEEFAQSIYNDKINISENSWDKFRHIFIKIDECLNNPSI